MHLQRLCESHWAPPVAQCSEIFRHWTFLAAGFRIYVGDPYTKLVIFVKISENMKFPKIMKFLENHEIFKNVSG